MDVVINQNIANPLKDIATRWLHFYNNGLFDNDNNNDNDNSRKSIETLLKIYSND